MSFGEVDFLQSQPKLVELNKRERYLSKLYETPGTVKSKTTIIITFTNIIFLETAYGFQAALKLLGFEDVRIMGAFDYSEYLAVHEEHRREGKEPNSLFYPIIQLAIGHSPMPKVLDYIVLHTENAWFIPTNTIGYQNYLDNARAVLTYSHSMMGSMDRTYIVPMYARPVYFEVKLVGSNLAPFSLNDPERILNLPEIYDICLPLHFSSGPRVAGLDKLVRLTEQYNRTMYVPPYYDSTDPDDLYTKERLMLQCKVVINIHAIPETVLETHRINLLLALGRCVISEQSSVDPYLDQQYIDVVNFTPNQDIVALFIRAESLLRNVLERHACQIRGLERYHEIMSDVSTLELAMNEVLELSDLQSIDL